ncbi:Ldh family oxidoreductase [Halalkalicoccus sp. GCM10025322]|uniref:Ldh family oxidoreductase n=2 Tax=Halococcaceae TaxID=1963270 RepID=UPI002F96B3A3
MVRVTPEALKTFTEELLIALGTRKELVDPVSQALVNSNLRGHHSHGVRQIVSKYMEEIKQGRINPHAAPSVEQEGKTWAQVDGNLAYGQAAARLATEIAVQKAGKHTIGIVGLNDVSHIGRVGEFAEQACSAGMGFLAFVCNPASAWVAPPGSTQRRLSTNPVSIGAPTFDGADFPFIADLSTSQVAHGKIKEYAVNNDPLPEDWAIGDGGESLTDARAYEYDDKGALLPLGGAAAGHKGFNLSVMSEVLAANVTDGSISGMKDSSWGNHVMFVAIDLSTFTPQSRIANRASAMIEYVRSTEYSDDVPFSAAARGKQTLLPGEAEQRAKQQYREDGIPFCHKDARDLAKAALDAGVNDSSIPAPFQTT